MIRICINRNSQGQIYGFRALNHGNDIVCAGVSTLVFNTVNSIETFTEEVMSVDKPQEGSGYIELYMPDIKQVTTTEMFACYYRLCFWGLRI